VGQAPVQEQFGGMPRPLFPASPSKLLTWLDCPRRYRMSYLDRPKPESRAQRAHTSLGIATHNALRDWWDLPLARRTPAGGAELVRQNWIDVGFRDPDHSRRWRERTQQDVARYLEGVDPADEPRATERTVAFKTGTLTLQGRIDRLDERDGEVVVVDYKTSRRPSTEEDARTSLSLALYAVAAARMFRMPCARVELHHIPSGEVVSHRHTQESLARKLREAESIARDAQRADGEFREIGIESTLFAPRTSPLCAWCDYRQHCLEGQRVGPEKSSWAALEGDESS
jgi:RecB family exonuclease